MQYQFRKPVKDEKKAAMGEMYRIAKENANNGEHIINFASGHPDTEILRGELITKYVIDAVNDNQSSFFQYGAHIGYTPLRDALKIFENGHGNRVKQNDDLLITYGATEGISLMAMSLINPGDRVIAEEPSYVNAIKSFRMYGANVVGVPLQNDGVDLDILENEMRKGAKFFYIIPNFNNPTGITTSQKKRKKIYELAVKYGVLLLEDNAYGELRYKGDRLPSIKDLDEEGIVIYISTLSKYVAPAMRIGYMIADANFINRSAIIKGVTTNGVTNILQYAAWKMFEELDMDAEIDRIAKVYASKLFVMENAMNEMFPDEVRKSSPDGGMYMWVTLPKYIDVEEFCKRSATELYIPITPGNGFCVNEPQKCTSMRFNFVKESPQDIVGGIEKVASLIKQYM